MEFLTSMAKKKKSNFSTKKLLTEAKMGRELLILLKRGSPKFKCDQNLAKNHFWAFKCGSSSIRCD
jgi:hypothetical protein